MNITLNPVLDASFQDLPLGLQGDHFLAGVQVSAHTGKVTALTDAGREGSTLPYLISRAMQKGASMILFSGDAVSAASPEKKRSLVRVRTTRMQISARCGPSRRGRLGEKDKQQRREHQA